MCRDRWSLESGGEGGRGEETGGHCLCCSVQFSRSAVSNSWRPHEPQHARPPCPSLTPPKLMSIKSVMPTNHLILCRLLLLLPSIFPSIRVFSSESALHIRWPKNWHFSFSISPSKEHPGLISFRMDWLDLPHYYLHGFRSIRPARCPPSH